MDLLILVVQSLSDQRMEVSQQTAAPILPELVS